MRKATKQNIAQLFKSHFVCNLRDGWKCNKTTSSKLQQLQVHHKSLEGCIDHAFTIYILEYKPKHIHLNVEQQVYSEQWTSTTVRCTSLVHAFAIRCALRIIRFCNFENWKKNKKTKNNVITYWKALVAWAAWAHTHILIASGAESRAKCHSIDFQSNETYGMMSNDERAKDKRNTVSFCVRIISIFSFNSNIVRSAFNCKIISSNHQSLFAVVFALTLAHTHTLPAWTSDESVEKMLKLSRCFYLRTKRKKE